MLCVSNKIQAVLLDLDGTLMDAFAPIIRAMNQTLQEFGLAQLSEIDIRRHTGKGDCSMKALFGEHKEAAVQRFVEIHDEDYLTGINAFAGAEALLDDLQNQGIPTAIVTSKGQHRAEVQIKHLAWSEKLQCIIGKLDGRASKPDPETLLLACDTIGVQAEHSIMLGDGIADMQAAKRAQCIAVGICTSFSEEELRHAGADYTFPNLIEAHTWLTTQIH